jgi:capsular exopolysaccharide synthesis family protein
MDRLEKAMEKARLQREQSIGNGGKTRQTTSVPTHPSKNYASNNLALVRPAEILSIAEAHLVDNLVVAHHLRSPQADIFRILRTQVLHIMNQSDFKTLAITSPQYGDGKSTIALNLGLSIALDLKQTVLLVDLDLRKPTLDKYLGLGNKLGLTDYLVRDVPLNECLARLPFDRLSVLPGGKALDNSSEVLGSPKMAELAHELKARYHDRFIIYDMPPVLAQDDSIAFLPQVDATLVIVRDGVTRVNDLKTCMRRLLHTNVIGTVLNNSQQ